MSRASRPVAIHHAIGRCFISNQCQVAIIGRDIGIDQNGSPRLQGQRPAIAAGIIGCYNRSHRQVIGCLKNKVSTSIQGGRKHIWRNHKVLTDRGAKGHRYATNIRRYQNTGPSRCAEKLLRHHNGTIGPFD